MTSIRGAITIDKDEPEQIKQAVKELLDAICVKNPEINKEIECIVFSSTDDIHSYYPAKAAREAGFENVSLFSAQEPNICGALPLCIRVLIFAHGRFAPKHVYLRRAQTLRKDLSSVMNIAIDGPAGSGKSTIAKALAADYRILYLDTGAMYRTCALFALRNGIRADDTEGLSDLIKRIDLDVKYSNGEQRMLLNGEDVTDQIRSAEISMAASAVAKCAAVREKMVEKQRAIAAGNSCVLDGRDVGTVVLPNAAFKFFMTASADVRAKRRFEEMKAKGITIDYETLKAEIEARDLQDQTRAISPLKPASDAIEIDTSDLNIEGVVRLIKQKIQERL